MPPAKTRAVPVLQDLRGKTLSRVADEVLFDAAEVLSEGHMEPCEADDASYHGSTLVTIRLADVGLPSPGEDGGEMAEALLRAAERSVLFHVRLMRLARLEAERRAAPGLPRGMRVTMEFLIDGAALLIDINVECPLEMPLDGEAEMGGEGL